MEQAAVSFIQGDAPFGGQYLHSLDELSGPIGEFGLIESYLHSDPEQIHYEGLLLVIREVIGPDLCQYLTSTEYVRQKDSLWQTLFALTIILGYRTFLLDEIIRRLVVCRLVERVGAGDLRLTERWAILEAARATVILPEEIFPLPPYTTTPPKPLNPAGEWIEPYAIGDLKIVRERLLKYRMGEVAYIESVLRNERKEVTNRRLRQVRESSASETGRTEESEENIHGTRSDLLKETQRTIAQDSITTTFCNFSTSYGPPTLATLDGSWNVQNTPQQPYQLQARSFAQDITTRTANRMARCVSETRSLKTLDEDEETVVHTFDNTEGDADVVGIYRWVNKVYRAHVENYGHRLLIEFMISDPAAGYIESEAQLQGLSLQEPVAPDRLPPPLGPVRTFRDITPTNYYILATTYEAQGVTPPPPEAQVRSASFQGGAAVNTKEIALPDGYRAVTANVSYILSAAGGSALVGLIGGKPFAVPPLPGASGRSLPSGAGDILAGTQTFAMNMEDSSVPVALMSLPQLSSGSSSSSSSSSGSSGSAACGGGELVSREAADDPDDSNALWAVGSYFVNVEMQCALAPEKFEAWQIETYAAILRGYQKQKAEYYGRAGSRQTGVAADNPLANISVVRNELKRNCMRLLSERFRQLVGFNPSGPGAGPPVALVNEPRYAQFFEQAFEWDELTFQLYQRAEHGPGADGGKRAALFRGSAPLFTSFLEARAASVLLPVRVSHNLIALYYLSSGMIWPGADSLTPTITNYVSIVNELKAVTETVARDVPDDLGWEIVVPTSMTMLQPGSRLPSFEPPRTPPRHGGRRAPAEG